MRKKILIIGTLLFLLIANFFGVLIQNSYADDKKSVEEHIQLAGSYIKDNPELLSKSLDALASKSFNEKEIVTNVDLLPISIGEIEFREGLRNVAETGDADDKSVFNTLVEEKLIMSYAIKNSVLPLKSEINSFIESEKSLYKQDATVQKYVDDFCSSANMSFDEYWNTYEYYNAFRIVTFKKAYDKAIEIGIAKGELKPLTEGELISQINTEYQDYWKKIKTDLKSKASITINKQYSDRVFTIDTSKLYL
ncbi:hypothetical protein [Desulfosporosinus hippei]|uniref:Uncharacterized protein n=1 Tax=Desulfosporosinus hippei DSM 8344 TaxID=1121419 RepID=A0A1G8KNP9_9FIRM|nr:hypothetical protein [Desulfosporosinus hippei]SDI44530.1 hypothetical protein SAMN05443529_13927 [Desulfosporosinus hippei DSM 8344]